MKKIIFSPFSLFLIFTSLYSASLFLTLAIRKETMLQAAFYTHLHLPYILLSLLAFFINKPGIVPQKPKEKITLKALLLAPFFFFGIFFLYIVMRETVSSSVLFSHLNLLPTILTNSFFALFFCFYFFEKIVHSKKYEGLSEKDRVIHASSYLFLMLTLSLMVGTRGFLLYALTVSLFYTFLILFTYISKKYLGTKVYAFILSFCIMAGARLLPLGFIPMKQVVILFFVGFFIILPTIAALFPKKNTP